RSVLCLFFSSRRRHTRFSRDWSSDVCSSDLEAPPTARTRRMYDLLTYRFVQEVTQKETARRLGISPRHLRREQQQAIRLLAEKRSEERRVGKECRARGAPYE